MLNQYAKEARRALEFCATQDTSDGEDWLEDCGGIAQEGDSLGNIACRIAFATLLCECERILAEKLEAIEDSQAAEGDEEMESEL